MPVWLRPQLQRVRERLALDAALEDAEALAKAARQVVLEAPMKLVLPPRLHQYQYQYQCSGSHCSTY